MALETLGAVGAVCQLAAQCIYVLEIVDKVRRSTETLKGYQTQLQGLRILSEAIGQNPLLQTREIISHTQSILEIIKQHDDLNLLIEQRRLSRIWTFIRVERRLSEHTKNIEILKSTLAISIQDQQCRMLDNIDKRTQISAMAQNVKHGYEDGTFSERTANSLQDDTRSIERQLARCERPEESSAAVLGPGYFAETRPREPTGEDSLRTLVGKCLELSSGASIWTKNTASAGVDQHNGDTIIGVTKEVRIDLEKQVWVANEKEGWGRQHNGFDVRGSKGGNAPTAQITGVAWAENNHTNAQNGNDHHRGPASAIQHNGHLYQPGPGPGHWRRRHHKKSR